MKPLMAIAIAMLGMSASFAHAETTQCTEITSIPTTISVQGVYCLKQNLTMADATGAAILIETNNVVVDLNGLKLGGAAAGSATTANGIEANNRKNITIRNGIIRGFLIGVKLGGPDGFGHVVEDVRIDGSRLMGLYVSGNDSVVRRNQVTNTGNSGIHNAAFAMYLAKSDGSQLSDNVISGVTETAAVYGIYVSDVKSAEISGNYVMGLETTGTIRGLYLSASSEINVYRNWFINKTQGNEAIYNPTSDSIDCIGNISINYVEPAQGCDYEADQQSG